MMRDGEVAPHGRHGGHRVERRDKPPRLGSVEVGTLLCTEGLGRHAEHGD
jgi:hypothetical protein